jgi:hypothetical protein
MSALLEPDCDHPDETWRLSPEVRDWDTGTASTTVTHLCAECRMVLRVEVRERRLVRPDEQRRGYCGDGSDPDCGSDRHLSGGGWALRLARSRRAEEAR